MIEAYLDESGIHGGAKICVIAGYFGGPGKMRKLEKAWKRALADFSFSDEGLPRKGFTKTTKALADAEIVGARSRQAGENLSC